MLSKIINNNNLLNLNVLRPITPYNLDIDYMDISMNLQKYVKSREKYYEEMNSTKLIIENRISKYLFKKASYGEYIWDHNCVDIITKNKLGLDISCLSINDNFTSSKSIIGYYEIDKNFLLDKLKLKLNTKIDNLNNKFNTKDLFYCFLISDKHNIYLSAFQFNPNNIHNINLIKKKNNSIYIKNFIDPKFGYVIFNLIQKRLELKLNCNIINKFNTIRLM